ncbi:bifunctional oligoribonuclease/PAP phosphatase NrnA [Patescibacteria group bacterium]|nr:MAG: bifunctional oligoribonuclease/PAP phosphatase NrnA [Patescibacteria group bacterium]
MQAKFQELNNLLLKAENIVIAIHQNPDGDALGSAAALAEYLSDKGKNFSIYCATAHPENFKFLSHVNAITAEAAVLSLANLIVVMDSGDLRYAGLDSRDGFRLLGRNDRKGGGNDNPKIINIDHHISNEQFGFLNITDSQASATAQIVYDFFRSERVAISPAMATALLTGLVCDTDNFTNGGTTPASLEAAGHLLRSGANLPLVHRWVIKNSSLNLLKLWGIVLERLEKIEEKNLAYTYITNEDYLRYGITELGAEGIANLLNKLGGVQISLLIRETMDGKIKGSFRTTSDNTDVSALAKKLGGGGHAKAAGFTTEGTIEDVLNKILTM